jgi:hypothetical protein
VKELLLLLHRYPPDRRVSARRWGNLVGELERYGTRCTVVAAGGTGFVECEGESGERVIRAGIANGQFGFDRGEPGPRKSLYRKLIRQGVRGVPPVFLGGSSREWLRAVRHDRIMLEAANADLVLSSYGPLGPLLAGAYVAARLNKPWIADIRDSFEAKDGDSLNVARAVSRFAERQLLMRANARLTVGDYLASHLSARYQLPFHAIYNGWTPADITERRADLTPTEQYLYYAGSIYRHQLGALEVVLKALERYPNLRLRLRVLTDSTAGGLARLIALSNCSDRVDVFPSVDPATVQRELSAALAVLVLEDLAPSPDGPGRGTVTGKLFGLLASGVPGIAVSSPDGEIRSLAALVSHWSGAESPEQIVSALARIDQLTEDGSHDELQRYQVSAQARFLREVIVQTWRDHTARSEDHGASASPG